MSRGKRKYFFVAQSTKECGDWRGAWAPSGFQQTSLREARLCQTAHICTHTSSYCLVAHIPLPPDAQKYQYNAKHTCVTKQSGPETQTRSSMYPTYNCIQIKRDKYSHGSRIPWDTQWHLDTLSGRQRWIFTSNTDMLQHCTCRPWDTCPATHMSR